MGWKDRTTLYWRAGNKEWNTSLQDGQPDLTPRRRLGRSVLNYLPAQKHLNLTSAVREYCEKAMSQDDPLPLEEILTFLMAVGEPHVVIKSILAAWGGDKVP
jgi:hypothetical protein